MTSAPVHHTGPAEDTRHAYGPTLNALRGAVVRSADLWRRIDRPDAPAPGLIWTAAETAAHVVGDLRDYTQALTRHANGYMTHANRPTESPSTLSAKVNARHLEEMPERNLHRLADMLEASADAYLNAAAAADPSVAIATPNGLVISPATMTALLLGEQLIHGLDISRSARIPWPIAAADAYLVIPGVLSVAPQYVRPNRAAGVHISFELRMRGGPSYRLAVDDGTAEVTEAGKKADCVINADPVAFLLLGYGRISQLSPVLRGQLRPGGRKPWLAMKFGTLLSSP
ncbi:maleylpyruvate isomerase N-terminal domain-containing protein [Mycobacterium sp.]|jgi:Mycothiol maleylpyruvate isomerase N-terminal domain|uniref:maleylpyruvate isomerase N-terminal domain-containing protein n=1 Tax=Mycobacterium sp. TaxID=1785 RepID=UPI002BF7BCCD|nr:maleylpyruvate isomerase N-terminal domain-containing protein [Mycobacterium sp.]HTH89732.1 maleylpyruvate isomerase N-terminal domain-containing protein [Mycobacterium sp.]